jgi:hypothetical protein
MTIAAPREFPPADGRGAIAATIATLLRDDARWTELVSAGRTTLQERWGAGAAARRIGGIAEACDIAVRARDLSAATTP